MLACPEQDGSAYSAAEREQQLLAGAVKYLMATANAYHQAGRFAEAEGLYRRVLENNPYHPAALINMALIARSKGLVDIAVSLAERAILAAPEGPQIHFLAGEIFSSEGHLQTAEKAYGQALLFRPQHAGAHHGLGLLLHSQERNEQARDHLEVAVRLRPDWGAAHNNLGTVYRALRLTDKAIASYRRALACGATQMEVYRNLGDSLNADFVFEEAMHCYEQALRLAPGDQETLGGMAVVLEKTGKVEQAYELIRPAVEAGGCGFNLVLAYVKLSNTLGHEQRCIDILQRFIAEKRGTSQEQLSFSLHLAQLYDAVGRYDEAFDALRYFNDHKKGGFDRAAHQQALDLLISSLDAETYRQCRHSGCSEETPVFIVGMPRSGTSLVEQILASHPEVNGAGELPHMVETGVAIAKEGGAFVYGPVLPKLDEAQLATWAGRYLEKLGPRSTGIARVTDKMPYNYFYAAFIHMLFPKARIIHCVRNPIDTCLSCYFRDFKGAHPYKYDLSDLVVYYQGYQRLMAHWREELRIPMLEVRYEDLVADQEGVSRRIVEYCGLEWDVRCLLFHKSDRQVKTASYQQVRKPIYTSSVGRWRHYEKNIDILLQAFPQSADRIDDGLVMPGCRGMN